MRTIEDIDTDFAYLDDWEDRYRYLIELGRELEPLPEAQMNDSTKVPGCVSQVWLTVKTDDSKPPRLHYSGQSDAHIVKGLVAIVLALFSNRTAAEILETNAEEVFASLGLKEHLTPQRSNGLRSMVARIRKDAESLSQSGV
ncbi:SufE family protein [Aureimonas fodinaquatilis]|uniref:SufE family protein n=1 Tax=Aureimonas fodinaquatilis TaxID=2565783 RepID=A0A5B0DX70_9HYPH|nr:SufE family protein [Aureimonas fodinaquatilis]KAA0971096.1 SufE family protein [Aureimonas fodinaquatilis]